MVEEIRVLHVDDEPGFPDLVSEYLTRADESFTVLSEQGPEDALARLREEEVDCVVSDYEMPGMDGLSLLKAVREEYPELPFVLFTGKGSEEIASEAISAGVTDYLEKESSPDQYTVLANRVRNAVERYRARTAHRRSEAKFQQICDNIRDSIWLGDADRSETLYVNDAYEEVWERPTGELHDDPVAFLDAVHPEDRDRVEAALETAEEGESLTYRIVTPDGEVKWIRDREFPVRDQDGEVIRVVAVSEDVTEKRTYERRIEALHDVATELRTADTVDEICEVAVAGAENLLDFDQSVMCIEEDGYIPVRASSEGLPEDGTTLMTTEEGLVGKAYRTGESLLVNDLDECEVAKPQGPYESTISVPVGDRGVFQAVTVDQEEFDEDDLEIAELLATHAGQAITSVETEARLREERNRLGALFENIPDPTVEYAFVDGEPVVEAVNPAFEERFGFEASEVVGDSLDDVIVPASEADSAEELNEAVRRGEGFTEQVTRETTGGEREFLIRNAPFEEGQTVRGYAVYTDLTERIRREEELELKTRAMDEAPVGITIFDPSESDYPIVYANEGFERLTGYEEPELLGENFRLLQGPETDASAVEELREAVEKGEPASVDLLNYRKDGSPFWNRIDVAPVQDEDGRYTHWIGFQQDVTERVENERHVERQFEQFEEFGSVLSHDLSSPLTALRGRLELAEETGDLDHVSAARTAAERVVTLVDDVAEAMKEGTLVTDVGPVDLGRVARETWGVMDTGPAELRVVDDVTIHADEAALDRLFGNLLRNAVEHAGPEVTVRVGRLGGGFYVEDDGPGVPDEVGEDVFAPGVTDDPDGSGFGGVSVKQIALAHGWELALAESAEGGARFEFTGVDVGV